MWEFCISVNKDKTELINYINDTLKSYVKNYDGIITMLEKENTCDVLIACNTFEKNRLILSLQDIIAESICYYYKKDFLLKNLHLSIGDEMSKQAFICFPIKK